MFNFTNEQIYIVTGASSGIGASASAMINSYGASVVAIGRNRDKLLDIQKTCKYPENFYIEEKDLTENIEGLPKYITKLKEKYGKFSGLVCCAGAFDPKAFFAFFLPADYVVCRLFIGIRSSSGTLGKGAEAAEKTKGLDGFCSADHFH